jgi:hypothetical protein
MDAAPCARRCAHLFHQSFKRVLAGIAIAAIGSLGVCSSSALASVCTERSSSTTASPPTVHGYPMHAFSRDPRPLYVDGSLRYPPAPGWVKELYDPFAHPIPIWDSWTYGAVQHHRVGSQLAPWAKWENGYTGDFYVNPSLGGRGGTQLELRMPDGTKAISFFLQPELGGDVHIGSSIRGDHISTGLDSCPNYPDGGDEAWGFFEGGDSSARLYTVYMSADDDNYLDTVYLTTNKEGPDYRTLSEGVAIGQFGINVAGGASADLLSYAPVLRYDNEEAFRADSVANITDWWDNTLQRANGGTVDHFGDDQQLNIDFLGATYPDGEAATEGDKLDAGGDETQLSVAAQTMRLDPRYADRTYGREVVGSQGRRWLQYWLWYYSNPGVQGSGGFGMHEGDWEMVSYRMKEDGSGPDLAAYAEHNSGSTCTWSNVQKEPGTGAPVAYVAVNSHASYFQAGRYNLPATAQDFAEGDGDEIRPNVSPVGEQRWVTWPGHWGGTEPRPILGRIGVDSRSPRGPVFQGSKWDDPDAWAAGLTTTCNADGAGRPGRGGPPRPRFTSKRVGDQVVVDYEISAVTEGQVEAASVGVTVDRPGEKQTPVLDLKPTSGSGRISLPVPKGSGALTVRMSAYSTDGMKSHDVSAPVGAESG